MAPRFAFLLALAAALVLPTSAQAALSTFGSNLDKPADRPESEQRDIAYWQTTFADGRPTTAPTDGQIRKIEVRGFARSTVPPGDPNQPGSPVFFLQALTPDSGTVRARISSQPFYLPGSDTGTPDTVTSYTPENFCVKQGEFLSLTGVGGWDGSPRGPGNSPYSDGTPLQVFALTPNANVRYFTANEGLKNGALFTPREGQADDRLGNEPRAELLMRFTLATGDDRSYECGGPNTYRPADPPTTGTGGPTGTGGTSNTLSSAATIPAGKKGSVDRKGRVYVGVYCPKVRACSGVLTLTSGKTVLGSGKYAIAAGKTQSVRFKLTKAGLKLVKKRRYKLSATATAVTAPGGTANTKAGKVSLKKRGA